MQKILKNMLGEEGGRSGEWGRAFMVEDALELGNTWKKQKKKNPLVMVEAVAPLPFGRFLNGGGLDNSGGGGKVFLIFSEGEESKGDEGWGQMLSRFSC